MAEDGVVVVVEVDGAVDVLPPSATPQEVLPTGPVCISTLSPISRLYWSPVACRTEPVNEFASLAAGHLVNGGACVVHQTSHAGDLEALLAKWRCPAGRTKRSAPAGGFAREELPSNKAKREDSFTTSMDVEDDQALTTASSNHGAQPLHGEAAQRHGTSGVPGVCAFSDVPLHQLSVPTPGTSSWRSKRQFCPPLKAIHNKASQEMAAATGPHNPTHSPHKPPPHANSGADSQPSFKVLDSVQNVIEMPEREPQEGSMDEPLASRQRGQRCEHYAVWAGKSLTAQICADSPVSKPVQVVSKAPFRPYQLGSGAPSHTRSGHSCPDWSEVPSHIVGQVAALLGSVKGVIVLSGVCRSWRVGLMFDSQLLGRLEFRLDLERPLQTVCPTHGVIEKSLRRRHCSSFPEILHKAAGVSNRSALTCFARVLERCGLEEDAVKHWTKLARLGDPMGGWKLGEALYKGCGGVTRDLAEAMLWLMKTAKQVSGSKHPEKQELLSSLGLVLGYMHLDGEAAPRDTEKAVQWFRVAAKNGSRDAEIALGWMFNTGQYA